MFGWLKPKLSPLEEMHRDRRLYREDVLRRIKRLDAYAYKICAMQFLEEHMRFLERHVIPNNFVALPVEQRNAVLIELSRRGKHYADQGERISALGLEAYGVWLDCLCFHEPDEAQRFWDAAWPHARL